MLNTKLSRAEGDLNFDNYPSLKLIIIRFPNGKFLFSEVIRSDIREESASISKSKAFQDNDNSQAKH